MRRPGEGLHWGRVLVGLTVLVGIHAMVYLAAGEAILSLVDRDPPLAFVLAGGIALVTYLASGLVVGALATEPRRQEPAVTALLGLLVLFILQLSVGMVNVFGLLIGAPFCFGAAYLGGRLGERLRRSASRSRRE